jgi:hypothetical protein
LRRSMADWSSSGLDASNRRKIRLPQAPHGASSAGSSPSTSGASPVGSSCHTGGASPAASTATNPGPVCSTVAEFKFAVADFKSSVRTARQGQSASRESSVRTTQGQKAIASRGAVDSHRPSSSLADNSDTQAGSSTCVSASDAQFTSRRRSPAPHLLNVLLMLAQRLSPSEHALHAISVADRRACDSRR